MSADLNLCPFCNEEIYLKTSDTGEGLFKGMQRFWVECDDCHATGPLCISSEKAREGWNKRPEEEKLSDEIEKLSGEIEELEREVRDVEEEKEDLEEEISELKEELSGLKDELSDLKEEFAQKAIEQEGGSE